jgi:phosphoserine phosphatase RsbU/P
MRNFIPMQHSKVERTIAYQLISFIFSFMLVVFFISILLTRIVYSRVMLDSQLDNMRHLVHERIYLIDGILNKVESLAQTTRTLATDYDMSREELLPFLHIALREHAQIHSMCFAPKGDEEAAPLVIYTMRHRFLSRSIKDNDYRYQDWYQIPYLSEKPYWTEPWIDTDGKGKMVISYSVPMYQAGEFDGVIRYDIALSYLQGLITDRNSFKIGTSFLVSTTGTLVAHPDLDLVMNQSLFSMAEEYNAPELSRLGAAMVAGEHGYIQVGKKSPFQNSWIYYQPLLSNHWSAGIAITQAVLMEEVNIILLIQAVASILIFLIVAIVIYWRAMTVSRPLNKLAQAADRIGAGDFEAEVPMSDKSHEIATLSHSFYTMQQSLKDYIQNLRITTEEKNKIRGDVIYASEIQTKLIPENSVHPMNIKELRAYGILQPAGDIGGDLYDYFMIDQDHFCFVIADVLGKGIIAAMAMTMVSTLLPSIAPYYKSSKELLRELNKFLCRNNIESNFVTALLGVIELSSGTLEYSNCGHVPLYVRKMDRSFQKYSETHSTALGVFENLDIGSDVIQLDMGDEIILFTDGITEAMNVNEEFLEIRGLEQILDTLPAPNPEQTAKQILSAVQEFARGSAHHDDITLLVIDYKYPGME